MHDKDRHKHGTKPDFMKSANMDELRDDSNKALEDGLQDLYLDIETVWNIARDHFGVSDQYLLKHLEENLRVLKNAAEGLVLICEKCRRPSSFGPSGIRKNCYYCGESLAKPKNEEISDLTPLFIPPKLGMADIDIIGESISASYTYASPLAPGKAAKTQNSNENTRLNTKAQQLYLVCQQFDERYRLVYPILMSLTDLISENLAITPSEFVGAMLIKPVEAAKAETCFYYPYSLLSVIWRYISYSGDIPKSLYDETKNHLSATRDAKKKHDEVRTVTCPNCGRETTPTGSLSLKCPYCAIRLRETTISDVFPDHI